MEFQNWCFRPGRERDEQNLHENPAARDLRIRRQDPRWQGELCKATVQSARFMAKHLKIEESELKDKSKNFIVNKTGQVIEERLISN